MSDPSESERDPARSLRRLIATHGPISLLQFMGEANARYYDSRDPLGGGHDGRGGDFVTAPEISQMFGELVGLWLVDIWDRAGRPPGARYVELGPGRGSLARDALRVMARQGLVPAIHLVEPSRELRAVQRAVIPAATWHEDIGGVPDEGPMLLVANEFFDALPIRQLVRTARGWRERLVGLGGADDGDRFAFVAGGTPMDAAVAVDRRDADEGAIIETCPGAAAVTAEIARRLGVSGGAALVIDYGHVTARIGSTLQAVRAHARVDPFATPGEADLTAHVDFAMLGEVARAHGARLLGTTRQGAWLTALGIGARASALTGAVPDQAEAIAIARDRLVADDQMGCLFKVMGLASPSWPDGAGFER